MAGDCREILWKKVGNFSDLFFFSGIQVVIDVSKPIDSRITCLKVRCADCQIPVYEDVDKKKIYNIIVPTFLYRGGDGFEVIPRLMKNTQIGELDMDAFSHFLHNRSPVMEEVGGRITILGVPHNTTKDFFSWQAVKD